MAFDPQQGNRLASMKLTDLTGAGWLLIITTVIGALGMGIPLLVWLSYDVLPAGTYPRIIFTLPVFVIGFAIYWVGLKILARMGKSVTKRCSHGQREDDHG